jgi:hypothetical protein
MSMHVQGNLSAVNRGARKQVCMHGSIDVYMYTFHLHIHTSCMDRLMTCTLTDNGLDVSVAVAAAAALFENCPIFSPRMENLDICECIRMCAYMCISR